MEWVLRSPQIHSTFSNLCFVQGDGYHVNENCNAALETILYNILSEDKYLRTYRRSISFGQNIKKDLIPLFIHATEDKTIELLVKILVNLTIPIECLLSVDIISKNDFGRQTVFEINNLLTSTKNSFTDQRAIKVIINFIKKNMDIEQQKKLSPQQCTNISNSILLLRNILHIPEDTSEDNTGPNGVHKVQNRILWNIFNQSIDKVLMKLISIPENNWGVATVQLVALLYKDQNADTLHKLLHLWLERLVSESSEDNESNTSPPDRGSENSSPALTSDSPSDTSDTAPESANKVWDAFPTNTTTNNNNNQPLELLPTTDKVQIGGDQMLCAGNGTDESMKSENEPGISCSSGIESELDGKSQAPNKTVMFENSDCGYGTQVEHQESISTSSNEDEQPAKMILQRKTHNLKQRANNKGRSAVTSQDRKRKKLIKKGKSNIVNIQDLSHQTPTDEAISTILMEFTVEFLLNGYNSLVQTLHGQILTNMNLEIDTSHFFWLVTYFLQFATQMKVDLNRMSHVLSFDIVSYLTAEGVNLCEQFELAIKFDGNDLKPTLRRLHLVVTAIREFVQTIEAYKKFPDITKEDHEVLCELQMEMCETEELRSLLVLLLRLYNPKYHSKQYLQDLIVSNHILLMFVDSITKLPDYQGSTNMHDHIKQFATPEIMIQYGILLEDYAENGEFVNDCIFTLMHHVGGELDSLITLFQPKILKAFTSIWQTEFEICDNWSDLIEYVINTFIKKPHSLHRISSHRINAESFDDDVKPDSHSPELKRKSNSNNNTISKDRWTEEEISALGWNYMQCGSSSDIIGDIVKLFEDGGIEKTRGSVLQELFKQNMISKTEFETISKAENDNITKMVQVNKDTKDAEIGKLCEQLALDGHANFLHWVQKVLLDICFAKIYLQKKQLDFVKGDVALLNTDLSMKKSSATTVISPIIYQSLLSNQSIPLVAWTCQQATICKNFKFLRLLHKLGFHMPVDSGKIFIRIPSFWTPDILYEVAGKAFPIDTTQLKFSLEDVSQSSIGNSEYHDKFIVSSDAIESSTIIESTETFFQIRKRKHFASMDNSTPILGCPLNMGDEEADNQNWYEMVQKSQEYKLALCMTSQVHRRTCISHTISAPSANDWEGGMRRDDECLMLPSDMSISPPSPSASQYSMLVGPESSHHSECDSASVASGRTQSSEKSEEEEHESLPPAFTTHLSTASKISHHS